MGEAKQHRLAIARSPCICGSGRPAGDCCFNGTHWHKPPAVLGLRALSPAGVAEKCYMKELESCRGGISGEHLISQSVLRLLQEDDDFSISGVPWLEKDEIRIISPKTLTANCLCRRHNEALSPLDAAALSFSTALKSSMNDGAPAVYLVSGHDIERWLLKTLKALAVSGNLARGRERLSGAFADDMQVLRLLDEPTSWPEGAGLYCPMKTGDHLEHDRQRVQVAPIMNAGDELNGMAVSLMGLVFVLMLTSPQPHEAQHLNPGNFRPGSISVSQPTGMSRVLLSWDDGKRHDGNLSLSFVREVPRSRPVDNSA